MKKLVVAVFLLCGLAQASLDAKGIEVSTLATGAAILSATACGGLACYAYSDEIQEYGNSFLRQLEDAREGALKKSLIITGTAALLFTGIAIATRS